MLFPINSLEDLTDEGLDSLQCLLTLEIDRRQDEVLEEGFVEFIEGTDHTVAAVLADSDLRNELHDAWLQDA